MRAGASIRVKGLPVRQYTSRLIGPEKKLDLQS